MTVSNFFLIIALHLLVICTAGYCLLRMLKFMRVQMRTPSAAKKWAARQGGEDQ